MKKETTLEEAIADTRVEVGIGSIYEDLGKSDHREKETKSDLVLAIAQAIKGKKITQTQAATLLGISQPKLSDLLKGRTRGYSIERLMLFLNTLDLDVKIVISPKAKNRRSTIRVCQTSE